MNTSRTSLSSKLSSIILDENLITSSFVVSLGGLDTLYADYNQNFGINTTILPNKLTISCADGDGIRLVHSTTLNYGLIQQKSNGTLQLISSNNLVEIMSNINITNHNGIDSGLYLSGSLVQASATELNYLKSTISGTAVANKALVVDNNKDITSIRNITLTNLFGTNVDIQSLNIGNTSLTTNGSITSFTSSEISPLYTFNGGLTTATPILPSSGGTGHSSYTKGNILVASNSSTLDKLSVSTNNGFILETDSTSVVGLAWSMPYIDYFDQPVYMSSFIYTFGKCIRLDRLKQNIVKVKQASTNVNLSNTGLNGVNVTTNRTGTVFPNSTSTTLIGTGTSFTTELAVGSIISIGTERRKITSIISDTELTIDTPFLQLNKWTLGATGTIVTTAELSKFGTSAFNGDAATTSNVTLEIGSPNINIAGILNAWTVEFFVRITRLSAQIICASSTANTFRLSMANSGALSIFLGQGMSFNIANGTAIAGNLTTSTYFHIAIVFNDNNYRVFINGVLATTITSTLKISSTAFNSFIFGGSAAAFNGQIDEVRISSSERYPTDFTPTTVPFISDDQTLCLNHFENTTSVTLSDDKANSNNQMTYFRGGGLCPNSVFYLYAICNDDYTLSGYIVSESPTEPYLPIGYTLYALVPFYIPVDSSGIPYAVIYNKRNYISIGTSIPIITNATNVAPTVINTPLGNFIPFNATAVDLLITHDHASNKNTGITIGHHSLDLTRTILTTSNPSIIQTTIVVPLATQSIDTFLTESASGTTYSVSIIGVYLS